VCDLRNDQVAADLRLRVNGAISDLHAADGQYHFDCYTCFATNKAIAAAANQMQPQAKSTEHAFEQLVIDLDLDKSQIWNSVELYDLYMSYDGHILTKRNCIEQLGEHFGDDLLVLSGEGVANILVFKSQASKQLRIMDEYADDIDLKHISKDIIHEANQHKDIYNLNVTQESASDATSPLLMPFVLVIT